MRQPDRAIDRAFQRHVDRLVRNLRRGAGEIDDQIVAAHLDGRDNRQVAARRIGIVEETVDMGGGGIVAVGQRADGVAHQPLGIVHQVFIGRVDRVEAVLLDQRQVARRADLRRLDLRIHVADHERRGADVVAQHLPDIVVANALRNDLDRLELQTLGIGVHRIDDAAAARASARRCRDGAQSSRKSRSASSLRKTGTQKATSGPWLAPA